MRTPARTARTARVTRTGRTARTARTAALVLGLGALTLTTAACGADVEEDAKSAGDTSVTVTNCGRKVTYDKVPERVVTNDVGITEFMFALGLTDRMAGFVMPDDKGEVDDVPWKDGYQKAKWLSKKKLNRELTLDARADFVFAGWNYGFNEAEGFTPKSLEKLGIDSYILTESCRNGSETEQGKSRGLMPPLDALYADLRNLGKIFGVEDRAEALIKKSRKQVADAQARIPKDRKRPTVFLYDDGRDKPLTAGRFAGPHSIITKAGGDNVMKDIKDSWETVGWETVVDRDPEVILINDYGDVSAAQKEKFLKSYGPLKNVSAIRNDRIYSLDYVDLVESPRNPAAIVELAEYLRKLKL